MGGYSKIMIKGFVFDMDGLMFDTERLARKGWRHACDRMGCNAGDKLLDKTLGLTKEETDAVFVNEFGEKFDILEARRMRNEYVDEWIEKNGVPLKKGLHRCLAGLRKRGYVLAVASSTEQHRVLKLIKKAHIWEYIDVVLCGDMVSKGKPYPEIYTTICKIMNMDPSDCLALEDSANGVLSAFQAGLPTIMIPDLEKPGKQEQDMAIAVLESLDDMIPYLQKQIWDQNP